MSRGQLMQGSSRGLASRPTVLIDSCFYLLVPVNAHAEVNILNLIYIVCFIFYSSMTKLSNDMRFN